MNKPKLLLHICCVGCGVYVSQSLKQDYQVILFFYNPNIWPKEEYEKRLAEANKISNELDLSMIEGEYEHSQWLKMVDGHEADPERGQRCIICCKSRLETTAAMAKKLNCDYLATTLTTSPHKDALAINRLGEESARSYGIKFLNQDFKKHDGFNRSAKLSRQLGLYRQNYCGCEFSQRQ
jgi:predicted adenine nucleotide alpha hydrolase (AANH) superfamily ATPase